MDNNIKAIFEISPSAMLALKDGKIVCMNSRAARMLGCNQGASALGLIPDHILTNSSTGFVSSAIIKDRACSVRVEGSGGIRYLSIEPERSGAGRSPLLNDSLMCTMLSTLFNIGLAIDRLRDMPRPEDDKGEKYLSLMSSSYYSLLHSLSNLSTAMALKEGTLPFTFRATDLCRLCSELVSSVAIMCRERGLNIEFSSRLGELYAWADGEKLERIILNLLSNAISHTAPGGSISVGLERSGDTAYISVDDTGCGISPAIMPELFTAYERELELSEMSVSGGGLGLGIARGLAQAHEGALIIESREGKGTSVRVLLPLRTEHFNILESPAPDYINSGINLILTELSGLLDPECYGKKYGD